MKLENILENIKTNVKRTFLIAGLVSSMFTFSCRNYSNLNSQLSEKLRAHDFGPVLLHGDSFDSLGARNPYIFTANDTFYLYYDAAGKNGWLGAVATSTDLHNWTKHGYVLSLGDSSDADFKSASYPIVTADGNNYFAFYLATRSTFGQHFKIPVGQYRICSATASNPLGPWVQNRTPILPLGRKGSFDELATAPAFLLENDSEYLLFYSGAGRVKNNPLMHRTLGVARSKTLAGEWAKRINSLFPQNQQIENASLYFDKISETWFLFTNHVARQGGNPTAEVMLGQNRPIEYTDAVIAYWSKDLLNWDVHNKAVVLDSSNVSWNTKIIGLPSVIEWRDTLWVFYDGKTGSDTLARTRDGSDHMGRDIGLSWIKLR